ncbi:ABC transporter permease subunit [Roseitalea porphyridii]|uniref:ABC transporter permease subunit n=2 Tax=Roseitalea porphyridii TaxID=1852022 RepID=A0A4P6UXV0_9HYPH|nr:ABC transporter permease subunit [Roseitalea porphyridii]
MTVVAMRPALAGAMAAGVVLIGLCLVAIGALAGQAGTAPDAMSVLADPTVWRIVRFTLWQAVLSTLLSVGLAIPVAIAFHRLADGWLRRAALALFALPLALPQIVAVLGIVALYGEQGVVRALAERAGLAAPSIYGLSGILIAHVFFNLPLAARILFGALAVMPAEYDRLAGQLGMGPVSRFRLVDWPIMRPAAASASALIFMLCVTSFAIVLILGGGPRATTLEVALYQALTFDFDIPRAVVLTLLQLAITITAVALFALAGGAVESGMTVAEADRRAPVVGARGLAGRVPALVVLVAVVFVALPFIAIIAGGLVADLGRLFTQRSVLGAIGTSIGLGLLAALLAVLLAGLLCRGAVVLAARRRFSGAPGTWETVLAQAPSLILVVPPIVIAAGWFIALRTVTDVYAAAPFMVVSVNAAMAMPFAARLMLPAMLAAEERHGRLCAHLGIGGLARARLVSWPVLRAPLIAASAFAFALSLGDLGVIALFGSEQVRTMPFLILQRMGAYRTDDAAGLALILMVMTMILMLAAEHFARRSAPGAAR